MTSISLENVTAGYSTGKTALDDVTLDFESGRLTVVIGPSGCGKTTLLRVIAGLKEVNVGKVRFDDKGMNGIAPRFRNLAMVFQSDALYSHLSVRKNLAYGDRRRAEKCLKQAENHGEIGETQSSLDSLISTGIQAAAKRLGIDGLLDRKPFQLSGGERQRVALGRTLVRDPAAFLLDEPFSGIDAVLKDQLRGYVKERQSENNSTMILVTHHQEDALLLADSIVVMNEGRVRQVGSPDAIYDHPDDVFVASFFGRPAINLLEGELVRRADRYELAFGENRFQLGLNLIDSNCGLVEGTQTEVTLGIRPESIALGSSQIGSPGELPWSQLEFWGIVVSSRRVGVNHFVELQLKDGFEDGSKNRVIAIQSSIDRQATEVSVGDEAMVLVDVEKIHFFDTSSGRNIRRRKTDKT